MKIPVKYIICLVYALKQYIKKNSLHFRKKKVNKRVK